MSLWGHADRSRPPVSAMIVEPRCHSALPLVVANMRANLPDVPIQVFYGKQNKRFVHEFIPSLEAWAKKEARGPSPAPLKLRNRGESNFMQKTWGKTAAGWPAITLEPLPQDYFTKMNYTGYSLLLESPEFWDLVLGEKVLTFEPDTWVCKDAGEKLQTWLQYDYVGAPWNHYVKGCPGGVGNGGFSLRTRSLMRELAANGQKPNTEDRQREPVIAEDVWFCKQLMHSKERKDAGASFSWTVPDAQVQSARKGIGLDSPSFSLAGSVGRFHIRYFPKGESEAKDGFCSAYLIGQGDDSLLQIKLAIGDEERLLGEEGPVLFKAGEQLGVRDFSVAPLGGVTLTAVLIEEGLGAQLPIRPVGDSFAEEERVDIKSGNPLGVHRPWNYEAMFWALQGNCPGLDILHKAWEPSPDPAVCPQDGSAATSYLQEYRQLLDTATLRSDASPKFGLLYLSCSLGVLTSALRWA